MHSTSQHFPLERQAIRHQGSGTHNSWYSNPAPIERDTMLNLLLQRAQPSDRTEPPSSHLTACIST
jgi:hypothetical protein